MTTDRDAILQGLDQALTAAEIEEERGNHVGRAKLLQDALEDGLAKLRALGSSAATPPSVQLRPSEPATPSGHLVVDRSQGGAPMPTSPEHAFSLRPDYVVRLPWDVTAEEVARLKRWQDAVVSPDLPRPKPRVTRPRRPRPELVREDRIMERAPQASDD